MPREYRAYLNDILEAIEKIENYMHNISFEDFTKDGLIQDAAVRNLEVIGEAVKHIPDDVKSTADEVDWKKIAGLRDILIHAYFGIDEEIIWDIIQNKVSLLKERLLQIISQM